jgi:hypothetical protein
MKPDFLQERTKRTKVLSFSFVALVLIVWAARTDVLRAQPFALNDTTWARHDRTTAGNSAVLILDWEMDEGSGSTLADSSGNGHGATLTNSPVWITPGHGGTGRALGFNGANQCGASTVPVPINTNVVTLSFWLWATNNSDAANGTVSLSIQPQANPNSWSVLPYSAAVGGNAEVILYGATGALAEYFAPPAANAWHLWTIVLDNSTPTGAITVYIDGAAQTLTVFGSAKTGTGNFSTAQLEMMVSFNTYTFYSKGALDAVRLYAGALTPAQVATLYGGGNP